MKPRTINGRWTVQLPDHVADHPFLDDHERARFDSMAEHLEQGQVVYDVGAEHGWSSAVIASIVGPEHVVLVEPCFEFWANLRLVWEANAWLLPAARWCCFAGHRTDLKGGGLHAIHAWPGFLDDPECGPRAYPTADDDLPEVSIDGMVTETRIVPAALSIDVEGAEGRVLAGATTTLRNHRPLIWLSVHSDEMLAAQSCTRGWVFKLLDGLGYRYELLAEDHEQHWLCEPT